MAAKPGKARFTQADAVPIFEAYRSTGSSKGKGQLTFELDKEITGG
jgi:hypothetical protein